MNCAATVPTDLILHRQRLLHRQRVVAAQVFADGERRRRAFTRRADQLLRAARAHVACREDAPGTGLEIDAVR